MNNRLNDTLSSVAEEVFESLAFVLLAFEEEESSPPADATRTVASIAFAGAFEGMLFASVSDGLLPTIAANMLGLDFDEIPPQDVQRDALKELMNVTCGNLLPKVAGEEVVFDVGAAEVLPAGVMPATVGGQPPLAAARLHLEGGWADLALFAPERVAAGAEPTA